MALIKCPECGKQISDKAKNCPSCGIPAAYFHVTHENPNTDFDYANIGNIIIAFDQDYCSFFGPGHYITSREHSYLNNTYGDYYKTLKNKMIFHYVCNNASNLRIDIESLKAFLRKMHTLDDDITTHNTNYIDEKSCSFSRILF